MAKVGIQIRRAEDNTGWVIGYLRSDGQWSAVQVADGADPQTVSGQLMVLAEAIVRKGPGYRYFNPWRQR
jgi:hypothetical protein